MNSRPSKNLFSTYVWSKVDSCFCEAVYSQFHWKEMKLAWNFLPQKCLLKIKLEINVQESTIQKQSDFANGLQ